MIIYGGGRTASIFGVTELNAEEDVTTLDNVGIAD